MDSVKRATSSEYAAVFPAVNFKTGTIHVRDIVHGVMDIDEFVHQTLFTAIQLGTDALGIEVTGLEEYALYPFRKAMAAMGVNITLIELRARGGGDEKAKVMRGNQLVPFYRRGQVFHHPTACMCLEEDLGQFPRPRRWDIIDAFAHLPQLLELGGRYMMDGEFVGLNQDEIESEYAELIEEDAGWMPPLPEWRVV